MLSDLLLESLPLYAVVPSGDADDVTMIESSTKSSLSISVLRLSFILAISLGLCPILSSTSWLPEANSM